MELYNIVVVWCRKRIFDNLNRFGVAAVELWFGVEKGYLTTRRPGNHLSLALWFGVEKGYLTTFVGQVTTVVSCGLV